MLGLHSQQKGQLLIRLEGGFGSSAILEYLLSEGYHFMVKLHSARRSKKLGQALEEKAWLGDHTGLGWARVLGDEASSLYANSNSSEPGNAGKLQRSAVRCKREAKDQPKKNAKAKT